ncbi:hypothetical protein F5Y06DRAFT_298449 [Hypoxylon sp. FL0890]|nr:hypothetical protein F5Y06DRAFT_298449 [Hypoxylon sp. FL0890]
MNMKIYEYVGNPNDRNYKRRLVSVDAYGSQNAKILARTNRKNIATDITLNADNYAQYVLSKYVQSQIGGYPWLPIANGEAIGEHCIDLLLLERELDQGQIDLMKEVSKGIEAHKSLWYIQ